MLVKELIAALEMCDSEAEVWLAIGRWWPFQYVAAPEVVTGPETPPRAFIVEGAPVEYMSKDNVERLGW